MRKILFAAIAVISMSSGAAEAAKDFTEGMDDHAIAEESGEVIGGAEICGYALNMEKVQAFVEGRIAEMGGNNREDFRLSLTLRGDYLLALTEVERNTQCILQKKLAQKYGFID